METPSTRTLRRRKDDFCSLRDIRDLADLVEVRAHQLSLMSINPSYQTFEIPKGNGQMRLIENPTPKLKWVQRHLNRYFQAVYYAICSPAAYGFMVNPRGSDDPRHIVSNAQRHLGCQWLYNADVESFFHRISFQRVYDIFWGPPFDFEEELAQVLAGLCTYLERLPMGAPTSPALSNFACQELDRDLLDLSAWAGWTYTRFADDFSFSMQEQPSQEMLQRIESVVQEQGFQFNPQKVTLYGPEDRKVVTGLSLEDTVRLPPGFVKEMHEEILKLKHVREVQARSMQRSDWVNEYEDRVEGMITFAAFVLGDDDQVVLGAEAALKDALQPTKELGAMRWIDFGYF